MPNSDQNMMNDQKRWDTAQTKSEPALRYDAKKSRVDLIDPNFILALGEHYRLGAEKYADRNWEKGMSWSRCYGSALRHMAAFMAGEDNDPETGSPHVIAAAWNMAALYYYMTNHRDKDDRPIPQLIKQALGSVAPQMQETYLYNGDPTVGVSSGSAQQSLTAKAAQTANSFGQKVTSLSEPLAPYIDRHKTGTM